MFEDGTPGELFLVMANEGSTISVQPRPLRTVGWCIRDRGDLVTADASFAAMQNQQEAPPWSTCGSIMVRSGSCYKCANCGTTSRSA